MSFIISLAFVRSRFHCTSIEWHWPSFRSVTQRTITWHGNKSMLLLDKPLQEFNSNQSAPNNGKCKSHLVCILWRHVSEQWRLFSLYLSRHFHLFTLPTVLNGSTEIDCIFILTNYKLYVDDKAGSGRRKMFHLLSVCLHLSRPAITKQQWMLLPVDVALWLFFIRQ